MSDLLPCPFCGSTADYYFDGMWTKICCSGDAIDNPGVLTNCPAEDGTTGADPQAIERWNTRPSPWISVDERLPEGGKAVLLWSPNRGPVYNFPTEWFIAHNEITHWQEIKGP